MSVAIQKKNVIKLTNPNTYVGRETRDVTLRWEKSKRRHKYKCYEVFSNIVFDKISRIKYILKEETVKREKERTQVYVVKWKEAESLDL